MVFLDVVVAALVAGKLAGGRIETLADTPIKGMRLAFAAIALQVVAFPSGVLPWGMPPSAARGLWLVSYAPAAARSSTSQPAVKYARAGSVQSLTIEWSSS